MNGQKQRSTSRRIRIAPVAHGVRMALAASVAALALAGTGEAQAVCVPDAAGTIRCNGNFTNSIYYGAADLIVVLGDTAPTVVDTTATGGYGVYAFGSNSVQVTSAANISTVDGPGIIAFSYGLASVVNTGDVTVVMNNPSAGGFGIVAYGTGAQITNSAAVTVTGGLYGEATGLLAVAQGDDPVHIDNSGAVVADSVYGMANGIIAGSYGAGDVTIANTGTVRAMSQEGNATGVYGLAGDGLVSLHNAGTIAAQSDYYGNAIGVHMEGGAGGVTVDNQGLIMAYSADALADGVFVNSVGAASITNRAGGTIYGAGYAWGAGIEAQSEDLTTVTNAGDIIGLSAGRGYGVYASGHAGVTIDNSGTIAAQGYYAYGVLVQGTDVDSTITIRNSGDIIADPNGTAAIATGVDVKSVYENTAVVIDNSGNIVVDSEYGSSGINVLAGGNGSTATITNSGAITVNTRGKYYSYGANVSVAGDVNITNTADGSVAVLYGRNSYGIHAVSGGGNATVANAGSVVAYGAKYVTGVTASAQNGIATGSNSGSITLHDGWYQNQGLVVEGLYGANADNTGTIHDLGFAADNSFGIRATSGLGNVQASNGGDISVAGYRNGVGIYAVATTADVSVVNSGTILARANSNGAFGVLAAADQGNISVSNTGDIAAGADYSATSVGAAFGIRALADQGDAAIDNAGRIYATSMGNSTFGIQSHTPYGTSTISNSGSIESYANSAAATAYGVRLSAETGNVANSGTISARSLDQGVALGIYGAGTTLTATNSGSITAQSAQGQVMGVRLYGDSVLLSNTAGDITATTTGGNASGVQLLGMTASTFDSAAGSVVSATTQTGVAVGVDAASYLSTGTVTVTNAGDVLATSTDGQAFGINGSAFTVNVNTSGNVAATSSAATVVGVNGIGDAVSITADGGNITATTTDGNAFGARLIGNTASTFNGAAGSVVSATTQAGVAFGVMALANNTSGTVTANSAGDVLATSTDDDAFGIYGSAFTVNVSTSGNVAATSSAGDAAGVEATGHTVAVNAAGSIAATSDTGLAFGIYGQGDGVAGNSVTVSNAAAVTATSSANDANGIRITDAETAQASNSGVITATATAAGAYGIIVSDSVTAQLANAGSITADGAVYADGIRVAGAGTTATVANTGSISAVNALYATGIYASIGGAFTASNSGDITVDGGSYGVGVFAITGGDASVTSSGTVDVTGPDGAIGIGLASMATATLVHSGTTTATTTAGQAAGIAANGDTASQVSNSGTVTATGGTAAIGVGGNSNAGTVTLSNSGQVNAETTGAGYAWGMYGTSATGTVSVTNSGRVNATHADEAVGIHVSGPVTTVTNSGIVNPMAANDGRIAVLGEAGNDTIHNTGHLLGALVTNDGDDVLNNGAGGVWHVFNTSTDFGNGSDSISNAAGGVISLTDGVIAMGAGAPDNAFTNAGVITVSGAGNTIDMGTATSTLVNDGLIDFGGTRPIMPLGGSLHAASFGMFSALGDGVPDDVLTINGNLGGTGELSIDVDFDANASDELYVNGNMAAGAVQTVNVNLSGLPNATSAPVDFAWVTGDSTEGSFVAGTVNGLGGSTEFLNLTVDVISDIDASNARPDVFSIGVIVDGLNDVGSLSSLLPAAAQSLVASQVGTWRQRMGVVSQKDEDAVGLSPWFRYYYHTGDMNPGHVAANFNSNGNFAFEQTSRGWELGLNASIQQTGINVGILFGRGKASQHLTGDGIGTDHLDSNTVGLYATWLAKNGMYLDVSHRWTDFDADMFARDGLYATHGYANAFNVEFGYPFVLGSGFAIEPQAQYTRTKIDGIDPIRGLQGDFINHDGESERGRLGVAFHQTFDSGNWMLTPYASISAIREFEGRYDYSLAGGYHGSTDTSGTSGMVELGLGARANAFSVTAGASWTDGGKVDSALGGQVVLRYDW